MPKLSKNDRLAYNVGLVTLRYNDVQCWFYLLFRVLMHEATYLAHPTFFALKSDRGQRDMLRALAAERLKNHPDLFKTLNNFVERANQLGGRRNDALHAIWEHDLPRMEPKARLPFHNRLVGKDAHKEMIALVNDLTDLEHELVPFFRSLRETLRAESKRETARVFAEALAEGLAPRTQAPTERKERQRNGHRGNPRAPAESRH